MVSDLIKFSLQESIGKRIGFFGHNDFYFEGIVIACDDQFLKYDDRKKGVRIISLDEIKEVSLK